MKIKTSDLEGAALDAAVAVSLGWSEDVESWVMGGNMLPRPWGFRPSTDWSQGGPILESRMIEAYSNCEHEVFVANEQTMTYSLGEGDTLLIAAMRAIAASEIGDEVDVPEELL